MESRGGFEAKRQKSTRARRKPLEEHATTRLGEPSDPGLFLKENAGGAQAMTDEKERGESTSEDERGRMMPPRNRRGASMVNVACRPSP